VAKVSPRKILFICSSEIRDNGIRDIVFFAKLGKLGLRIMVFGILEFHENVHFRIMGFGGKGIFGKQG
jgi:hypothetical protein